MLKKNALAVLLAAGLTAGGLGGWSLVSFGSEQPPLTGLFADNFTLLDDPVPAPQDSFEDGAGNEIGLADFAGQVVLLNFWATWCAPCVREMPALDRLQARLGGEGLAVVAVSADRGGTKVVEPFFAEHDLTALAIYIDVKSRLSRAFKVRGLPTTMLIDRRGNLVGAMEGPAEWDGPDSEALIRFYLEQEGPAGDDAKLIETKG